MTLQLATARISTKDPAAIDITAKSSTTSIGKLLAPTWDMVSGVKRWLAEEAARNGEQVNLNSFFSSAKPIPWEDYCDQYYKLIRSRYANYDRLPFLSLLKRDRAVLTCFCTDHNYCHRTLAADIIVKLGASLNMPVEFLGEVE